jgi:putative DNA primase/helicase
MLGESNVSSVRLEMFSDKFQMGRTVGKLVNVVDETDRIERMHEGIFKTYVGEGLFFFDVKHKNGFEARPTARILILSNDRLPVSDRSEGLWRRMILLPFKKTFIGQEDPELLQKLMPELAGVFNWAIQGLARLRANGWTVPAISKAEKAQYVRDCNPARTWIEENHEPWDDVKLDDAIAWTELYAGYQKMCNEYGIKHRLTMTSFNKEVKAVFPDAQVCWPRRFLEPDGKAVQIRAWKGFRRKPD